MSPLDQVPSVGRVVHYVSYGTPRGEYGKECRAATITEVTEHPLADGTCGLAVMNPEGMFFKRGVAHAEDPPDERAGGTWHWPERT